MYQYLDLIYIKKKYGENMAHLCFRLFPIILENEGILYNIMTSNFLPSRDLYYDIVNNNLIKEFKKYIFSFTIQSYETVKVDKNPKELFSEKGYKLYECKSQSDLNSFMKYYHPSEMLCSFKGDRLKEHYIFFAIKKNIDSIKRNNENPNREDDYSTSILCIQFDKGENNYVKIISRYNHTIKNPDATLENNLENINIGLTKSFEQEYNLNILNSGTKCFSIPGYIKARDDKFYKYSYKIDNVYYCQNNIIVDDGIVIKKYIDKSRYIFIDYYIVDLQDKRVIIYKKNSPVSHDSFINCFNNILKIKVLNQENNKIINFTFKENVITIKINQNHQIIEYYNPNIEIIPDNFMIFNKTLRKIDLPNAKIIGNMCLPNNNALTNLNIPEVTELGEYFLYDNTVLEKLVTPQLQTLKLAVLKNNCRLKNIYAPNLKIIDSKTFIDNDYKSIDSMKLMIKLRLISMKNILKSKINIGQKYIKKL